MKNIFTILFFVFLSPLTWAANDDIIDSTSMPYKAPPPQIQRQKKVIKKPVEKKQEFENLEIKTENTKDIKINSTNKVPEDLLPDMPLPDKN